MLDFKWSVLEDTHGSDHYPILLDSDLLDDEDTAKRFNFNLRRTSGVAGDPRGTLLVIISKTIWNFFMGFQICLKHLKICHMPKFHKISLISNYVIKA